jgi:membrane-associated protease RseP (regulator of RpoE activity)
MRAPPLRIPAGASLWIRFPNGIPAEAKAGDILEGVATSGLATDSRLDFLGVQPGSRVWAQVVSASPRQGASTVKLHVYKLGLKGGHTYPVSAILTDVSGDSSLLKVSPGGTLVASVGNEELSLAGPERNFLAKLLKPVDVFEGPEYYAAGPGLWFKTVEDGLARRLEVTQVVAKRSAEAAGLKPGDRILEIDGTAASKLDFSEAVSLLYGPPGSAVRLKVLRVDKGVYDSPRLQRGVFYRKGTGIFAAPGEHAPLASRVLPGSPAEKAGIREGDSLLQAGATNLAGMSESQLGALLQGDLVGDKELVVQTPGKAPRAVPIAADLFPTVIRVDALLARGAQKQP